MSSVPPYPRRKRLATFVHISDLHIGKIDPASGDAQVSPAAVQLYSNSNLFDGLLGHHGRALQELASFVDELKRTEPDLRLIVTGDLTRCGDRRELILARRYIEATIDLHPCMLDPVGLRLGKNSLLVPGSRDQWGGAPMPFDTRRSQFRAEFRRALPFVERVDLKVGKRIAFIGIDSDADVASLSTHRLLAIGAFQSQVAELKSMLPRKRGDEVRILLIHHAWSRHGIMGISRSSKDELAQFIVSHEISAILCGHSETALIAPFQARSREGVRTVLEFRAGSATQYDHVPLKWKTLMRKRPTTNLPANSLLVHRVYQNGAALEWEAVVYVRGMRGFTPLFSQAVAFPLT